MRETIRIVEVGPRDGLQAEPEQIDTGIKLELIDRLGLSGLSVIEATSFVHPRRVPQLADALELMQQLQTREGIRYPVLVPNMRGLERAIEAGAQEVAFISAASETFQQKNAGCSIDESLQRAREMMSLARQHHIPVRAYVSCVMGCPYEGPIDPAAVCRVSAALAELGCFEISLGDTIGVGTAAPVRALLNAVTADVPTEQLAVHFHDTYGQALANILASVELGIRTVDASVAGLGGCPYAPGASGNVATEDVVYLLEGLGFDTGVDLHKLVQTGHWISSRMKRESASKAGRALFGKDPD